MLSRRLLIQGALTTMMTGSLATPRVSQAGLAQPKLSPAAPPDLDKHPFIDAHSHVWSPDIEKWPLEPGQTRADLKPASFTPQELLAQAHPERVGRVVLIQHHISHGWNNDYLTDCAAAFPGTFAVVGMIDDRQPGVTAKMDQLLRQRVTGFRITPFIYKESWLDSAGMHSLWKHASETGQAVCCLINPEHLSGVAGMCERYPQTRVVIDHFARIGADGTIRDRDVEALAALAKHRQTHVKLSAYYALGKKQPPYLDLIPMIRRLLDAFSPERCMWASDAPYQIEGNHGYGPSLALLRERVNLSSGDRDWLLRKCAEQVYFARLP